MCLVLVQIWRWMRNAGRRDPAKKPRCLSEQMMDSRNQERSLFTAMKLLPVQGNQNLLRDNSMTAPVGHQPSSLTAPLGCQQLKYQWAKRKTLAAMPPDRQVIPRTTPRQKSPSTRQPKKSRELPFDAGQDRLLPKALSILSPFTGHLYSAGLSTEGR